MSVFHNALYYSNRSGALGETEDEREVLVQEQRICRARAYKLSVETNRRRKYVGPSSSIECCQPASKREIALEDRRKQWVVQEQKLREDILQQRHQRVKEATENFQRAHLPPSQRKRAAAGFKTRTPNLEEALHHIHGSSHLHPHPSQYLSSACLASRSCTPSPKPPGGVRHLLALSAADAYTKLLLEQSLSSLQNSSQQEPQIELTDKEWADQQVYSNTPNSETESLSSLDSLENEDLQMIHNPPLQNFSHQSITCPQSFYLPVNSPKLHDSKCSSSPLKPPHPIVRSFLEEILHQESELNLNSPSTRNCESADENKSHRNLKQETFDNLKDQSQSFDTKSTLSCQKEVTQWSLTANSEQMTHGEDSSKQKKDVKDKGSVVDHSKTLSMLDTTPLQFTSLTKYCTSESKQQTGTLEEKCTKNVSETQPSLQADWNYLNIKDQSQTHKPKPKVNEGVEPKPPGSQEGLNLDPKNETDVTKLAKALKLLKSSISVEEHNRQSTDPVTCSTQNNNVRFLKGILKNHLKSKSATVKFTYTSQHLLFTKEVATLIRDSVELARTKLDESEQKSTVKKKLRWFDEVNGVKGEDRVFRVQNRCANLPQQAHKQLLRDHSDQTNLLSGVSKNISSKTYAVHTGPQSSRQAWADVGLQKCHSQERIKEPTTQKKKLCIGGSRIPRRAHSARVTSGFITSRARKGTVIRPQSAREAQHVAKTLGKTLLPRPPPKLEVVECVPGFSKAAITDEAAQRIVKVCKDNLESQIVAPRTDTVVYAPTTPYCTYAPPDDMEESARLTWEEKGVCLDRTPTDEEITLLWNGVRSALASNDGDPQSLLAHNGPLSTLPQACANLSHVTINGDSLSNGLKGSSRTGGFLLSSSNGRSPIRRQAMESNMMKNRVTVENSRNQSAGSTQRKPTLLYQIPVPTQHLNKSGHAVYSEDRAHESVDCTQNQQSCNIWSTPQTQRTHSHITSALSMEEQAILQSLQRLDQRLQYVQDTAGGNPAVMGILALEPSLNQPSESVQLSMRRRGLSANNHILNTKQHSCLQLP